MSCNFRILLKLKVDLLGNMPNNEFLEVKGLFFFFSNKTFIALEMLILWVQFE